jgi:hypothetical protein
MSHIKVCPFAHQTAVDLELLDFHKHDVVCLQVEENQQENGSEILKKPHEEII